MPIVSTAAGSSAPQQAGDAQTAQPAKTQANQGPAKAPDIQDSQAAKADDDQDENPGTSAYDRDTPKEDQDPAKAADDHPAMPAQASDEQESKPEQSPSNASHDQDAKPAKVAEDQEAQPSKSSDARTPVKAAEHALAQPPATPEQAKQQQLENDSATLLQLVQELKVEVEKAGSNTLSLAALRKADEIQKLAKNLKERMREAGASFSKQAVTERVVL